MKILSHATMEVSKNLKNVFNGVEKNYTSYIIVRDFSDTFFNAFQSKKERRSIKKDEIKSLT